MRVAIARFIPLDRSGFGSSPGATLSLFKVRIIARGSVAYLCLISHRSRPDALLLSDRHAAGRVAGCSGCWLLLLSLRERLGKSERMSNHQSDSYSECEKEGRRRGETYRRSKVKERERGTINRWPLTSPVTVGVMREMEEERRPTASGDRPTDRSATATRGSLELCWRSSGDDEWSGAIDGCLRSDL